MHIIMSPSKGMNFAGAPALEGGVSANEPVFADEGEALRRELRVWERS